MYSSLSFYFVISFNLLGVSFSALLVKISLDVLWISCTLYKAEKKDTSCRQ